jgi:hypothetical protein
MELDVKDPKTIVLGAMALAAVSAGGSLLGLTIEPKSVTDLRVENGHLEGRLLLLEGIVEDCEVVLSEARSRYLSKEE